MFTLALKLKLVRKVKQHKKKSQNALKISSAVDNFTQYLLCFTQSKALFSHHKFSMSVLKKTKSFFLHLTLLSPRRCLNYPHRRIFHGSVLISACVSTFLNFDLKKLIAVNCYQLDIGSYTRWLSQFAINHQNINTFTFVSLYFFIYISGNGHH